MEQPLLIRMDTVQIASLPRGNARLAERMRKEHWERHRNNKTYEQWLEEQAQREIETANIRWDQVENILFGTLDRLGHRA